MSYDTTNIDDDAQTDYDTDLAEHVDATIERLAEVLNVEDDEEMATPLGRMSESDLLGMVRPMLYQWVASHRETALSAIAVLHVSTGDLLDEHEPDVDREELATRALDDA